MDNRRNFLQKFLGVVGGVLITPQMKVRAFEKQNALKYERKFRENSLPTQKLAEGSQITTGSMTVCASGCYTITGQAHSSLGFVSGRLFPLVWP